MQTPSYFNNPKLDAQLMQWLREGHSHDHIVSQAKHSWPEVPEEYLRTSLQIMVKVFQNSQPETEEKQYECLVFLRYLHNQRMKELDRLEKRLEENDCPMSVHTLYRGFLRDAEAYCLKMLTLERDCYFEDRKADEKAKKKQHEEEQRQLLMELLNHATRNQAAEDKQSTAAPEPSKKQRNGQPVAVLSLVLGCCLSFWWGNSGMLELPELTKAYRSEKTAAHGTSAHFAVAAEGLVGPCWRAYRSATRPVIPSRKMLEGSGTATPINPGEPISCPLNDWKAPLTPTWLSWLIPPDSPAALSKVVPSTAAPKLTCVTMLPTESKINTPSPDELRPNPEPLYEPKVKPAGTLGPNQASVNSSKEVAGEPVSMKMTDCPGLITETPMSSAERMKEPVESSMRQPVISIGAFPRLVSSIQSSL